MRPPPLCARRLEELALNPALVRLLGEADPYCTVTGYGVTPVVGVVPPDLELTPNPAEVADWFEAPLDFVLDPANQRRMTAEYQRPHCGIIIRSTGRAARSGARPRQCWSICRGASHEARSAAIGSTGRASSGC